MSVVTKVRIEHLFYCSLLYSMQCTPCDLDSSFDLGRWIGLAILHHNAFDRTLLYENVRSRWLQQSHLLLLLLACSTPLLFLVASPILSPMIQNKPLIPFTRHRPSGCLP